MKKITVQSLRIAGVVLLSLPTFVVAETCTTTVPGGLVVGETWTTAGSPYCITGDIDVSLLTIEPGVRVLFDGPYQMQVLSTLTAVGTETATVVFSALDPTVPWRGIFFQDTPPTTQLIHCRIEYSNDSGIRLINSTPVIEHCTISNNTTANKGAGINATLASDQTLVLRNVLISDNAANPTDEFVDRDGGGLYVLGNLTLDRSEVRNNTVFSNRNPNGVCGVDPISRGGGIFISNGDLTISNSVIQDNEARATELLPCGNETTTALGGGVYFTNSGANVLSINNSIFSCNAATTIGSSPTRVGSGVYVNAGSAFIENVTVARNATTGIHGNSSAITSVRNSILYFNNSDGDQVSGVVDVTYSDVQGGLTGVGNIGIQPVFAGSGCAREDVTIVLGSPAIDTGDADPAFDDECFPPSLGGTRNDMGADGGPGACGWLTTTPPPFGLSCNFNLNQPIYTNGDAVQVDITLTNNSTDGLPIEIKGWVRLPSGQSISRINAGSSGSFVIPPGDTVFGPFNMLSITPTTPLGMYEMNCRLLSPVTGQTFDVDVNPFEVQ